MSVIYFSNALSNAIDWVKKLPDQEVKVIIRDMFGRIRFAVSSDADSFRIKYETRYSDLNDSLGRYSPGLSSLFIFKDDLINPQFIFESPDLQLFDSVYLLDRQVTGQDWLRAEFNDDPHPQRVTFYGIKGGVGRSTALSVLASELAKLGKKVLVVDFDLESPGVSSLLIRSDDLPPLGIVDWFVEDAVGQSDAILENIVANSSLASGAKGTIRVAPAYGTTTDSYLEKLSRVYVDLNKGNGVETFGDRLHRLLIKLEEQEKPDIVLMDSRAGLHDVAAVTITRMDAEVFLFATNSSQTWSAYRLLFEYWQKYPSTSFREKLKVVDALVPETDRPNHNTQMLDQSYKLFQDTIYEEMSNDDLEPFSYDMNEEYAPHYPLPIKWSRVFQGFDPILNAEILSSAEIDACYGDFVRGAIQLLFSPGVQ